MRFIQNGPDIPDALLHARDEGGVCVLLWCGSVDGSREVTELSEISQSRHQ